MIFSASQLSTWMTCPLQAKFQYVDRLPTRQHASATFGSCIHAALEHYNQTRNVDKSIEIFKDLWKNPEKIGSVPDMWAKGTSFGSFMERGPQMLLEYHEKCKWESRTVLQTEHKFMVPFGEHHLRGFVDLLEIRKSARGVPTLRIVDYKTSKKQPFRTDLLLNIQFSVYVFASLQPEFWLGNGPDYPKLPDGDRLWEEMQDVPRRAVWYHLMTHKEIDAGPRDDTDFMRLYRVASEVSRAHEAKVFVPKISEGTCGWCSFTEPCGIPLTAEVDKEEDEAWF